MASSGTFDIIKSLQAGTESIMKQRYKSHNLYVKSEVPEEDLLIWNVKEGWEPLCKFLGKPIPEESFPHDNKTGDMEFIDKYAHKANFMTRKGCLFAEYYSLYYSIVTVYNSGSPK